MRDQLKPLEGQLVVIKGRITEKQRQADGTITVCLAAVEVRPLLSDVPLQSIKPIRVDHLWVRDIAEDAIDWRGLLRSMCGAGRVIYYRRGSGSVDLSISTVQGICLDSLWQQVDAEPNRTSRARLLGSAAAAINEGVPYWSWACNADKGAAAITQAMAKYERSAAAELATYLTSPRTGPCTRMRQADPFDALRRRRGRKQGAAAA